MRKLLALFVIAGVVMCSAASAGWYQPTGTDWYDIPNTFFVNENLTYNITNTDNIYASIDINVNGLPTTDEYYSPDIFENDSVWYCLLGYDGGGNPDFMLGYNWSGTAWQVDNQIDNGLTAGIGAMSYTSPSVFQKDGIRYMIMGRSVGDFKGYNWTGSIWQIDNNIIAGLPDVGTHSTPNVFEKDNKWYLVTGNNSINVTGYELTGGGWITNNTIVEGINDTAGDRIHLEVDIFEKDNIWYLIAGTGNVTYPREHFGMNWSGSQWQEDNNFISGIDKNINYPSPSVFEKDGIWQMIAGKQTSGFQKNDYYEKYMNFTASSLTQNTSMNFSEYDILNTTITKFNITSGTLDWLQIPDLEIDEYYGLYSGSLLLEIVKCGSPITFNSNLNIGNYSIIAMNYTNYTGIHGVIYEGITETEIRLPNVIIYIYNTTWSDITTSDDSGYYRFTNLSNTTYTLSFSKDRYEDVLFQYTTPSNKDMYEKDIYMQKSTGDYYSRHYCTFTLKNIFGARYSNVDTVVYDNGNIEGTGTTGSDGSVTFHLFEDVEYRITFINASQEIDESITITPRDNAYTIYVTLLDFSLDDSATVWASIDYHWTSERINASHGWINFTFTDSTNSTLGVEYWLNQTINNSYNEPTYYFTSAVNGTWIANSSYQVSQIVLANNTTWVCHFGADNPNLPSLSGSGSAVIRFLQGYMIDVGWDEPCMYSTVAICSIIFIGLFFCQASAATGAVVCVLAGWFFWWIHWLSAAGGVSFVMLCLATVLSILFVMRKGESLKA
jgi:hypothetical protein